MYDAQQVGQQHYAMIRSSFKERIAKLQAKGRKMIYPLIDLDSTMLNLYEWNNVWIVDGYLIAYEVGQFWCNDDLPVLHEQLVFKLYGDAPFSVVPQFLEDKAREAGCKFLTVGTALATSDAALASLYARHGFTPSAVTLMKEIA